MDLPPESLTAAPDQITLPDNIYDDVFVGAGLSMDLCAASSPVALPWLFGVFVRQESCPVMHTLQAVLQGHVA